jgi:glucose/arabinose dehydrogenase
MLFTALASSFSPYLVFAQGQLNDPSLTIQTMIDGLVSPTRLAFLDNNNILLLEKEGNVRLISNGVLQSEPVLQIEQVESNNERGLLGIAYDGNRVYLFVTESGAQVGGVLLKAKSGIGYIATHGTDPL